MAGANMDQSSITDVSGDFLGLLHHGSGSLCVLIWSGMCRVPQSRHLSCADRFPPRKHIVTQILTAVFCGCSILGIAVMTAWFALERWIFSQHHGARWLREVFREKRRLLFRWFRGLPAKLIRVIARTGSLITSRLIGIPAPSDIATHAHPTEGDIEQGGRSEHPEVVSPTHSVAAFTTNGAPGTSRDMTNNTLGLTNGNGSIPAGADNVHDDHPQRKCQSRSNTRKTTESFSSIKELSGSMVIAKHMADVAGKLKQLQAVHSLEGHSPAVVKSIHFSPNGKLVATSR